MSGGTLTPPRDPTWDSDELIAPVIPFRQRGGQPQQPTRVDRTPGVAIVVAPPDGPAEGWIHESNALQPHDDAATQPGDGANVPRSRRPRRLLIAGLIAATLAAGVAAALALSHAPQPHAQASDQHASLSTRTARAGSSSATRTAKPAARNAASHAKAAARKPISHAKSAARKPASRVKSAPGKTAHHATASHRKHATVRPAARHVSQTSPPASVVHATAPSVQPARTSAPATNPCADSVPGQLGC
jgi:hypothetical protein